MNKEEIINIAIAEACGLKFCWPHTLKEEKYLMKSAGETVNGCFSYYDQWATKNVCEKCGAEFGILYLPSFPKWIPDYFNDLNACCKMEKLIIEKGLITDYINQLYNVTFMPGRDRDYGVVFASAAARCEAFLKTIDKWNEVTMR